MKNKLLFILIASVFFVPAFAQQKIKDNTAPGEVLPNKDALLELESTNKGLLHARVQLIRTDDAAPLSQHRAGMMVYNTATANDVSPGIYYNNGSHWILVAAIDDVKSISYNPVTYELSFVDRHGETQVIHLEEVVKAVETVTALDYDRAAHILDYIDEDGVAHTFNLNVGTLAFDNQSNVLNYTSEDGRTTDIPLNNTSLSYDPALGMLRYVNTLGQLQEFSLSDVVDQLETVTSLNYDPATHVLTYVDEDRATHALSLDVGRLAYDNPTNTLTYTAEDGMVLTIPLNATDLTYSSATGVLTYVNSLGQTQIVPMTAIVKHLETVTTIVDNADGTFTYTDEDGGTTVVDISNLETLTKIALNPDNTNIDYTDEDGVVTKLDMTAIVKHLETVTELGSEITTNTDGEAVYRLTYSAEDGVDDVIDVKANNGLNIDVTSGAIQLGGPLIKPKTTIQTDADNTLAIAGLEYSTATDDKIVVADAITGELKALKAAMPKFFYMPSIIIPTAADQVENPSEEPFGTIDLYKKYQKQFGSPQVSSPGAQPLPVLPANELYYYITWYDQMVFENITVDEYGVLRYEIKPDADVTLGSFMNIVFAVKQNL